jgi:class 3 adenylate cyclase
MTERPSAACLLYADVAGGARLAVKLGEAEAGYAVERCLNRMSRCAEAYSANEPAATGCTGSPVS